MGVCAVCQNMARDSLRDSLSTNPVTHPNVRSFDIHRSLLSLSLLMATDFGGLYHPSTDSYWLSGAPWQKPSNDTLPKSADVVIIGGTL